VLARSFNGTGADGGVACADAGSASTVASTVIASRLAFKERRLAEFCGTKFEELWRDYMMM
jgi:hypothetical protein